MKHVCASPPPLSTWVGYFAGDLGPDEEASAEASLFSCARCAVEAGRIAVVTESVRSLAPPVLSPARFAKLAAAGRVVAENLMSGTSRGTVCFPPGDGLLVHRLGTPVCAPVRVDVRIGIESTGETLAAIEDAPFDPERGEVLIACQAEFAALPPDVVVEVRATDASGAAGVHTYSIMHVTGPS